MKKDQRLLALPAGHSRGVCLSSSFTLPESPRHQRILSGNLQTDMPAS
jgi:hypothetical protein